MGAEGIMVSFTRILCPVDFSDCSRAALAYAAAMGKWYGAEVTALHVFTNLPVVDAVPLYRGQPLVLHEVDLDVLRTRLQTFVRETAPHTSITSECVDAMDVRDEIVRYAG